MAEAEDVIIDAARHVTAYAQQLWERRRSARATPAPELAAQAARISLLLCAVYGQDWSLRVAQAPPPVTTLMRVFQRSRRPWPVLAVPSSQPQCIWLPRRLEGFSADDALRLYRAMALQQATRSRLRPRDLLARAPEGLARDIYLVLEAEAADAELARDLPGVRAELRLLRDVALHQRPPLSGFAPERIALERWLRDRREAAATRHPFHVDRLLEEAHALAQNFPNTAPLLKDWWTGEWPRHEARSAPATDEMWHGDNERRVRSAHLSRRPQVREADPDEDDAVPGAFLIQTAQPHEHAEDPMGAQRPTDRDADSAAEGHAESVAELAEARLVRSANPAHEVLISDDPPIVSARARVQSSASALGFRYPEWDYRIEDYREPGATVWESIATPGTAAWVERVLDAQRMTLGPIRRHFEMLRARRTTLHQQEEGDELDLDACISARADLRAGASLSERLYKRTSIARLDAAVLVLIDISGSTDGWLTGQRRIIDVEREALLPLSIALDGLGEPYAVMAFSGEGPGNVIVRSVKRFEERHSAEVALRIAGLEPERYTRAGAALRHASRLLSQQTARHKLLLLLSDGKPNDCDEYEGRYGVEDTRKAVLEARQAGLSTFCLTVDRTAATYLPRLFGPHHYVLLQQPERLPAVLLDWMKRLLKQ